jgi:hypothetical protein
VVSTLALRSAAAEAETFPKKRYRGTHIGYEVQHRGKHAPQERMRQPHQPRQHRGRNPETDIHDGQCAEIDSTERMTE